MPKGSEPRPQSWPRERRAALLASIPLFAHLPAATIALLSAHCQPRGVSRGGTIFSEGDPATAIHIAAEGRVKIVRETVGGRQVVLRLIAPGQLFGVSGSWGAAIYPASAYALDAAVVLQLPTREFTPLLAAHPELAIAVIEDLGKRLREAEARILDLETEAIDARLARAMLRLLPPPADASPQAVIALTRQDLADLTGSTLSTVSRTVSAWHRRGIVAALRERVVILDRGALTALARDG